MLESLPATLIILAWCALISALVVVCAYSMIALRQARRIHVKSSGLRGLALMPALVLGPTAVALSFSLWRLNLIYPVQLLSSIGRLTLAALAPACVLVLASGLSQTLIRTVHDRYILWQGRPFAKVALAYGKTPYRALRRVVILEALTTAWSGSLPWIFSELIVVEAVFNAPGLGLAAWQAARERNPIALAGALFAMTCAYAILALISAYFHRQLGRRMESYA